MTRFPPYCGETLGRDREKPRALNEQSDEGQRRSLVAPKEALISHSGLASDLRPDRATELHRCLGARPRQICCAGVRVLAGKLGGSCPEEPGPSDPSEPLGLREVAVPSLVRDSNSLN